MRSQPTKRAGGVVLSLLAFAIGGHSLRRLAQSSSLPVPKASLTTSVSKGTLLLASFQQGERKNVSTQPTRTLNLDSVSTLSPYEKTAIGIGNIPDGGGEIAIYDPATGPVTEKVSG